MLLPLPHLTPSTYFRPHKRTFVFTTDHRPVGLDIFLGHYLHRELWKKHICGGEKEKQLEEMAFAGKLRSAAKGVLLVKYISQKAASKFRPHPSDNLLSGVLLDTSFYEAEYRYAGENARNAQGSVEGVCEV